MNFYNQVKISVAIAILSTSLTTFASAGTEDVTLYLKWLPQYQFAGYLVAKKLGYYKKAGLDVKIIPGGPDINTVQEVADGSAQFGIQTPQPIFDAYKNGLKLKIVMVDFQHLYQEFMVKKNSDIKSIYDFKGKTIANSLGGLSEMLLPVMLKSAGLNLSDVRIVRNNISITPFLDNQFPIWNGAVGNTPYQAIERGVKVREFYLKDYAPEWYADVLFATQSFLKKHPLVASNFVKASQEGWEYSIKHPVSTVNIVHGFNKTRHLAALEYEAKESIPLMTSKSTRKHCFGWVSSSRIKSMEVSMSINDGWFKGKKLPPPMDFFTDQYLSCS